MRAFQTFEPPARRANRASLLALIGFIGLSALAWLANGAVTAWGGPLWPAVKPLGWLSTPLWSVLYLTIGVSAWLVWRRIDVGLHRKRAALRVWGWQLLLNPLWPAVLFGLHWMGGGLAVLVLLAGSIAWTIRAFAPLQRGAAALLMPYLAWVCYALYLNVEFWRLASG